MNGDNGQRSNRADPSFDFASDRPGDGPGEARLDWPESTATTDEIRAGVRSQALIVVAVALIAVVGLAAVGAGVAAPEETEAPFSQPPAPDSAAPDSAAADSPRPDASTPGGARTDGATARAGPGEGESGLRSQTPVSAPGGLTVVAVVTSPVGAEPALLIFSPQDGSSVEPLPPLSRFAIDPSGRWLAGMALQDGRNTLFAGAVGDEMTKVATGVRSFAWHDSTSGALAWSTGRGDIEIKWLDESERHDDVTSVVTFDGGVLRGWGDWGFAVLTSFRDFASSVIDSEGSELVSDLPGRYVGTMTDGRLLFTGSRSSPPLHFDPGAGRTEPVQWLKADDHVWALADDSLDSALVLIGHGGVQAATFDADLAAVAGERVEAIYDGLGGVTDVATSDDGTWVGVAEQGGASGSVELVMVNRGTGEQIRLPVPDVHSGPEWVSALAVVHPE